jgi:D-psicose/D-tagatose/L-ribulose 3-epimerase
VDFAGVFGALKKSGYDDWMTVEAFGQALPDLAAATKVWRPLFVMPEDVYAGAFRLMKEGWAKH